MAGAAKRSPLQSVGHGTCLDLHGDRRVYPAQPRFKQRSHFRAAPSHRNAAGDNAASRV